MAEGADRADLSLHAARLLHDRAARVGDRVGRRGRPRARFLAEQRARLAGWLLPTLATIAALTGALAIVELASQSRGAADGARTAMLLQAVVAIVVGASSMAIPFAKKTTNALVSLAAGACCAALLGWGFIAHASGGDDSRYKLVIPLVLVVCLGVVPLPPRVAGGVGACGYIALLVASPRVPVLLHLLVVSIAIGGVFIARARHKQILRAFVRIERLSAAVKRMRRVQEQLVVVEKLEALRVLVGGIAHELNNALAVSAASNQQAMKQLGDASPASAALKRAAGGLERIKLTVERLRRFAMAAEGTLESADVAAMLDFALESAIGRARSGVIVQRDYEAEVGAVRVHVGSLAEALFQVAKNAIESMPSGGTIRATVKSKGDRVELAVADEGTGIPKEQLGRVFDPYWRASEKGNKSGMGLSTVYGLVSAVGGSVKVESAEGEGTRIAIVVPRKPEER
jgi:signal transduction histidine kinase